MNMKKTISIWLASALTIAMLAGCSAAPQSSTPAAPSQPVAAQPVQDQAKTEVKVPKYVFLFIGDGMSNPQFQTASDYLGAIATPSPKILEGGKTLSFMSFPIVGSATTFDSTSFAPDSASTATSIATGYKTYSGVINMDETKTKTFETITEKLKKQLGYKIGIISTVNLNHATPAAFYAHQASRNNYYEISEELAKSGFDFYAGGGLKDTTGAKKDKTDSYQLAETAGYKVIKTQAEAQKLTAADGKALIIGEKLADSDSLSYEIDRADNEWALKDYVKKGIEVLDNDKGFFMMIEGGKIDWACHANDAGSTIVDTLALGDAVSEALDFYDKHPEETLILVTGDHETGGLTIGFAGTDYDTYLHSIKNQKLSYAKYDKDFVAKYKKEKTPFATVLKDIKDNFGLISKDDPEAAAKETLVLTDYETECLKAAYDKSLLEKRGEATQAEYVLYGTYEPLSVTITHILNNKSGINFSSYSHTGLPVPVFAKGIGQEQFNGYYDNTDIYKKMAKILMIQ